MEAAETKGYVVRLVPVIQEKGLPLSTQSGHYRPASETPFKWRSAGGPIVACDGMLAGWGKCL